MIDKPTELTVDVWIALLRAQRVALQAIEADLKSAGVPTLSWYDVLIELRRSKGDGMRPFELEQALLLAQHNVSRLIDRMVRAGYVRREACTDDGRGQKIHLTESGQEMQRRMWLVYRSSIQAHIGERLGNEDMARMLVTGLRSIAGKPKGVTEL
jgi:DNA-binding MarR family transcriptional regulator